MLGQIIRVGVVEYSKGYRSIFQNFKNILVTAASGGVGHYAVQLGNAHVRSLDRSSITRQVKGHRPSGRKYDAVVHCAPATSWSVFELAQPRGKRRRSAMWTYAVKKISRSKKKLLTFIFMPKDGEDLQFLVGLMKEGKLKTIIDEPKNALSRAQEAWSRGITAHATGKISS